MKSSDRSDLVIANGKNLGARRREKSLPCFLHVAHRRAPACLKAAAQTAFSAVQTPPIHPIKKDHTKTCGLFLLVSSGGFEPPTL